MTIAAIDRLVHHATILEFGSESYRKRTAAHRVQHPDIAPPTDIITNASYGAQREGGGFQGVAVGSRLARAPFAQTQGKQIIDDKTGVWSDETLDGLLDDLVLQSGDTDWSI